MKLRLSLVLPAVFLYAAVCSAQAAPVELDHKKLKLASANALVLDAASGESLYSKNSDTVTPIASITKLMTAMVVLDGGQPLAEKLSIEIADIDTLKGSHSRLRLGAEASRYEMLRLALMSSENRAASALGRNYPGGSDAFVAAMNAKAQALGMTHTHYADPTGLTSENVSTAEDLAKLVRAAAEYPLIHAFTTTGAYTLELGPTGRALDFHNTNMLVRNDSWDIEVSKTGFIREAGRCLVMLARIASRPVVIVLLDSLGTYTRIGDANRVKYWLETGETLQVSATKSARHGVAKGHFRAVGKPVKKVVRKYKRRTA